MRHLNIRWKLTLWYGGVLAIVLVIFGTVVYVMMRQHLMRRIDKGLQEELSDVLSEVRRADSVGDLKEWLDRRFAAHAGFDFQITRLSGERFFFNPRLAEQAWPVPAIGEASQAARFQTIFIERKGNWRIVHMTEPGPVEPLLVQVGRPLAESEHELHELLLTFLLAGPFTLTAAIAGGYFLACRVLRPVQSMTQAAKSISADRLSERIVIGNPHDELGELGTTLNQMIDRLEQSFDEMRRFTADAAHELRTPLAIIRSEAEIALRLPRTDDQYRTVLENLLEDVNRLTALADQLLFLSRQEARLMGDSNDIVLIDELLHDVVGNMQIIAQEKGVELTLRRTAPCRLSCDARLLRRLFVNILDNAIKYTAPRETVTVDNDVDSEHVKVIIEDRGEGIAPEHLRHVFDRFYRADAARSNEKGGAGLGLAICQSIVKGCGGMIEVESQLGVGTRFTVRLPINHPD